jgi:HK97 family phage prohead protease
MPKPVPALYDTFDALTVDENGAVQFLAAKPLSDRPGFDGYLAPFYTLTDRGTFFVPGAFKKSARERMKIAPHLWQHDFSLEGPIGKHAAAFEDDKGFRISVELNTETQRGAELLSNLRFGIPIGLSVGFDPIKDRTGSEADDALLDRSTAPDYLKTAPINELRVITEARFWESSSVTFGGLATAKPDVVHRAIGEVDLAALLTGLTDGTLPADQLALVHEIVAAHERLAAAGEDHSTSDDQARRDDRSVLAALAATQARLLAQGITL